MKEFKSFAVILDNYFPQEKDSGAIDFSLEKIHSMLHNKLAEKLNATQ